MEFLSTNPLATFVNAISMAAFTTAAQVDWAGNDRRGKGDWNTTLQTYVDSLQSGKADAVTPPGPNLQLFGPNKTQRVGITLDPCSGAEVLLVCP